MLSIARTLPFRRLYATQAPKGSRTNTRSTPRSKPLPHAALVARTASTPLAVRERRTKKFGATPAGQTDATKDGLTPTELARFERFRAAGRTPSHYGMPVQTEEEWLARLDSKRNRIRGFRMRKKKDGTVVKKVVGRPVYLPNIIFRLVRNHTPPGEPYNPYEATFRIPQSITKTDIRSYLDAVYGVKVTYIRTDNYLSPIFPRLGNKTKPHKTYKRAVVGLVDPFYYPLRVEDMVTEVREEREKWIEDNFAIQHTRNLQKFELLRLTKGQTTKGWKFNAPFATKRSHILRLVAERKEKRESLVAGYVAEMQEMRGKGERITRETLKKPGPLVQPPQVSSVPAVVE
ncbi:hypothetical protein BDQ12DRAFT_681587 [Crucibulum laeve]|uniref:Large ribosomal subunit protein uL23m n=1 Tax=Crucibulum laeve TaxID=68775 RepID=A0A5C3M5H4_9AGAR|nr:hypothetical protein BDQ12DRAFT_681587 [Crucibulum laeve]